MQDTVWFKRVVRGRRLVYLLWGLFLLAGCSQPEVLPAIPTQAVPAEMALVDGVSLAAGEGMLPPTWTPNPATAESGGNFRHMDRTGPTAVPTATPVFPTSTPRPTFTPTPTTVPTATPYVSIIPELPPTDELGPSKLGLHVIRNNDANIMEFVRQARPAVIKAVDDLGFLAEVKEVSPWTVTIGRLHTEGGPNYDQNPEEAAREFVASQLEKYRANPAVDYWEGYNEPDPNMERMVWYSRFEQERVRQMAEHGFRVAIGGFAAGVPELEEFEKFTAAIWVAKEHQGILTLHEYGAPDMTYLYGSPLPGQEAYPDRGALAFRYRWFYEEILKPADLVIPLVISEAGIDGVLGNRPGPGGYGWEDFQDYWVQQGWADNGVQAFLNQLAWYDVGVRQDGYVIGFTIFTAGAIGHWKEYDINPILPQLTNYVVSQR